VSTGRGRPTRPVHQVAAFDFDGTITRGETLFRFLRHCCGTAALAWGLAVEAGPVGGAAVGLADRNVAKARLLARVLADRPVAQLRASAATFAEWVVDRRLRDDALERLAWHRHEGHELVVVSASPELYVRPVVERLGVASVLATGLEVDGDGRVTGRLLGANVRAQEKADRLRAHLGANPVFVWAYGDSAGDRQMLAMADRPFRRTRRGLVPAR
jgi:phosphatidylglycerophosphatase C